MRVEIAHENIVIVANSFNPSVATPLWLLENGIVSQEEFSGGGVFTPVLVNFPTAKYHVLLAPEQIQVAPVDHLPESRKAAADFAERLVSALPHTPYTGLGLNFAWQATPSPEEFVQVCRELFFFSGSPIFQKFSTSDARFGGYMSMNALGGRLKLDVKPMVAPTSPPTEFLQFAFNFHRDLTPGSSVVSQAVSALRNYEEAFRYSDSMIESVMGALHGTSNE